MEVGLLDRVRAAAAKRVLYLPHAIRQMSRPDRMIEPAEVEDTLQHGETVEEYPDDPRGESCLLLGRGPLGRAIHVVCAPKPDYLAVISAYLPDAQHGCRTTRLGGSRWSAHFVAARWNSLMRPSLWIARGTTSTGIKFPPGCASNAASPASRAPRSIGFRRPCVPSIWPGHPSRRLHEGFASRT